MADRTVTVKLTADVKGFETAMARAEAAARKLRSSLGDIRIDADTSAAQTKLRDLQQKAERLSGSKSSVRVDADTAAALNQLEDLQRRMRELSSRTIGVDLDAGAARSELSSIQRDLERLNASSANPKVRLDSAAALAELRSVQSEVNRVDGRRANVKVDADVGSALAKLALVAAAVAGLPAVATIGLAVGGLGAAFGAAAVGAGVFGAVAIPALGRVNEALKQTESSAGGAGGAMKSAAQKAAELASAALRLAEAQDRVKDSADRVRQAQQSVKDAERGVTTARQDAARAAEDAAARAVQAAARIADAERSVQDAHRATQRAIEDLTRARERAQERIEDLALATEGGALSEERARLSIERAKQELAKVNASNASPLDKQDAALRLKEAEFALKQIQERNADLAKERADSDRKGVEGSDEVVAAKERILAAQRQEAAAERALSEARTEAARAARDGARDVADANQRVADAQRKVAEAQRDVVKAQRDQLRAIQALKVEQLQQKAALDQTASSSGGAATKMAKLSKAERELAVDIKKFKDAYIAWQRELEPEVFPVIRSGMELLKTGWESSTPLVKASAGAIDQFLKKANGELKTKAWQDFFGELTDHAPRAIGALGTSTINIANGLRGIVSAFLPEADKLLDKVEDITADFSKWGQGLAGNGLKPSPEFTAFINYVQVNGPKVGAILKNLATFVGKVLSVGAGAAPPLLDFLVSLSEKLAGLSPSQIEAVAKGVGLIFAAVKLGATIKIGAFVLLAETLSKMSPGQIQALAIAIAAVITAVKGYQAFQGLAGLLGKSGDAAGKAAGGFGQLTGVLKTAGVAALVYGEAKAFDALNNSVLGLDPNIDTLAKGLADFGNGGKPSVELLDQLAPKMSGVSTQIEDFAASASRLASDNPFNKIGKNITSFVDSNFGVSIDKGALAIRNLDQGLSVLVSSGRADEAARAFQLLAAQMQANGTPAEKLKELFPQYASSLDGAVPKTNDMAAAMSLLGKEVDPNAVAMERFNVSLGAFNSKTDAAQRTLELKSAFEGAKKAIGDSSTGLDINKAKIGENSAKIAEQMAAVIRARDAFTGYISKVLDAAKAAGEAAGKTGEMALKSDEARNAFIRQLPQLFELAGKNKEARDEIYKLGEGFGVNRTQADKAATGVKGVRDVIAELKSKKVGITADVASALSSIGGLGTALANLFNKTFTVKVRTEEQEFAAKISQQPKKKKAAGGIERYAAGGLRSSPAPHVVDSPSVLYGEGSAPEAFIPYASEYRPQAVQLLGQVASDFGLAVYNDQAAKKVDSLSGVLKETQFGVSAGLGSATTALTQTLGSSGSFTSVVTSVGTVGKSMQASWVEGSDALGNATTKMSGEMSSSVNGLSGAVLSLAKSLLEAKSAAAGSKPNATTSKKSGAKPSSGGSKKGSGKGSQGEQYGPPNPDLDAGWKPPVVTDASRVAPLAGGGVAYMAVSAPQAGPVNTSRVSAPQQMSSAQAYSSPPSPASGGSGGWTAGSGSGLSSPAVVIQEQNIYQDADADRFAESAAMRVRARGR